MGEIEVKTNQSLVRVILLSSISLLVGSSITFSATKITAKKSQSDSVSISTGENTSKTSPSRTLSNRLNSQTSRMGFSSTQDVIKDVVADPTASCETYDPSAPADTTGIWCCSRKTHEAYLACPSGSSGDDCRNDANKQGQACVCRLEPGQHPEYGCGSN